MWLKHPAAKCVMKPVRLACARLSIICINTASHHSVLGAGRLLPGLAWIVFDFILDFILISVVPRSLLHFFLLELRRNSRTWLKALLICSDDYVDGHVKSRNPPRDYYSAVLGTAR